jgi:hypothetical protein
LHNLGSKRYGSQPARLLTLIPWETSEIRRFAEAALQSAVPDEKEAIGAFLQAVDAGTLHDYYGDLPFHPLFLQFILDDVCANGLRTSNRIDLMERWMREKIHRDMRHHGIPSEHAGDQYEWLDDMLTLSEAVAVEMTTGTERIDLIENIESTSIEAIASRVLGKPLRINTIALYTLLVPRTFRVGRNVEVRFALRIAQEYFVARHLARIDADVNRYPTPVREFVAEIKAYAQFDSSSVRTKAEA